MDVAEGGNIEKSGALFNQQETVEKTGSSETYTQSTSKNHIRQWQTKINEDEEKVHDLEKD